MPTKSVKLETITVTLDDLYLDPNNPRFLTDLKVKVNVPDNEVEKCQAEILKCFKDIPKDKQDDSGDNDENFFGITDLVQSMRNIGFIPIDRVVVRRLKINSKKSKYLVIEGNRRISAAKKVRDEPPGSADPTEIEKDKKIKSTFDGIDVLLMNTEDLSDDDIHEQIGVILGLRHFGSVLEWSPLPKAVNIYNQYIDITPRLNEFVMENKRINTVVERLSVASDKVKKALKTFVVYQQLRTSFTKGPQDKHYTLLSTIVSNTKLQNSNYIDQDRTTFKLTEPSLEKLNSICQFEKRDDLKDSEKILPDEKAVSPFATIVYEAQRGGAIGTSVLAKSLLTDVEEGKRPVSSACYDLKAFKNSLLWTEALRKLLDIQENKLRVEDFSVEGRDREAFEDTKRAFSNVRKLLGI